MTSLRDDDDVLVLAGAMSLTDDDMFLSPSPPPSLERLRRGLIDSHIRGGAGIW